ncbi:MAG: PIG-L family deacetylase [Nitrospinae bacterium]|nr:PIG-L family deacetylase [Nitrospinota bacterium]
MSAGKSAALFFFPHQDDEYGVFQQIADDLQSGHRVCCVYITDGGMVISERRNAESLAVLKRLGAQRQDVFFAGTELGIPDGGLPEHLETAAGWIRGWLTGFERVAAIYAPAWEGGHPDHDALHALVAHIARERGMLEIVRQYSLYNSYQLPGPLFRVFLPLPENGQATRTRIPWKNRFRFLRLCLCYPSQAKTWLGLFPCVMFHYLTKGSQLLQPVSAGRIGQRPHEGRLYYEKRSFFTWEKMSACLANWQSAQGIGVDAPGGGKIGK